MAFKKIILFAVFMTPIFAFAADIAGYKDITAEKINYNVKSGEVRTAGRTEIAGTAGQKMTLADAYLSKEDAAGRDILIEWDEHTLVTAESLSKEGGVTCAKDVTYTACHNCDPVGTAWTVHASSLVHDSESRDMHFRNFWFDMYGVPILYSPYFTQPDPTVRYRSGLLLPELSTTNDMGTMINVPLYINFADNHDMTLTAGILTDENVLAMAEHRLRLEHASFDTTGSYTHTKDGLDRWHIFHNDTIELGENMRVRTSIQRTSDDTYLQKYDFYEDQPFLESNARLEMFADNGYATVDASVFQELRQAVGANQAVLPKGDILPKVHGTYQIGISENLYSQFMGDMMRISDFTSGSAMNRGIAEARVIAPVELALQKLTVSAAVRGDNYIYEDIAAPKANAARVLSSGYVDWEMPFVKSGGDWTEVIRPRARVTFMGKSDADYFLNMDSTGALLSDASLFVNNRYSGYDMWADGTYADYGVSWTGYNASGQSAEVFVGQTYDFDTSADLDPNSGYHDGASDVVGRIGVVPKDWLSVTNRFRFARNGWNLRHLETDMKVGARNYFSLGYIWAVQFLDAATRDKDVSEIKVGTGFFITDRLSVRADGIYNFTDKVAQRYNAGIYYNHPCWTLALVHSVDSAEKIYGAADSNLDFRGRRSIKLMFSVKMGQ